MVNLDDIKKFLAEHGFEPGDAFRIVITPGRIEAWSYVTNAAGERSYDHKDAPLIRIKRYDIWDGITKIETVP